MSTGWLAGSVPTRRRGWTRLSSVDLEGFGGAILVATFIATIIAGLFITSEDVSDGVYYDGHRWAIDHQATVDRCKDRASSWTGYNPESWLLGCLDGAAGLPAKEDP